MNLGDDGPKLLYLALMGRTKDLVEYGIDYAHFISLYCRGPLPTATVKNYGEKIEKGKQSVALKCLKLQDKWLYFCQI